ncbi:MAG: hypothetical protein WB696_15480 [Chthoniobacterales bacterium]
MRNGFHVISDFSRHREIANNQVVGCVTIGIALAMGLMQIAHDNTVVSAGMTPTGVPYAWAWLGICIEGDPGISQPAGSSGCSYKITSWAATITLAAEAKRAVEMLPISKDAVDGPGMVVQLAAVYAWTNELDLAFEALGPLTKTPNGIYHGDLKLVSWWEPLRKDPRFNKLLAELAPRD